MLIACAHNVCSKCFYLFGYSIGIQCVFTLRQLAVLILAILQMKTIRGNRVIETSCYVAILIVCLLISLKQL